MSKLNKIFMSFALTMAPVLISTVAISCSNGSNTKKSTLGLRRRKITNRIQKGKENNTNSSQQSGDIKPGGNAGLDLDNSSSKQLENLKKEETTTINQATLTAEIAKAESRLSSITSDFKYSKTTIEELKEKIEKVKELKNSGKELNEKDIKPLFKELQKAITAAEPIPNIVSDSITTTSKSNRVKILESYTNDSRNILVSKLQLNTIFPIEISDLYQGDKLSKQENLFGEDYDVYKFNPNFPLSVHLFYGTNTTKLAVPEDESKVQFLIAKKANATNEFIFVIKGLENQSVSFASNGEDKKVSELLLENPDYKFKFTYAEEKVGNDEFDKEYKFGPEGTNKNAFQDSSLIHFIFPKNNEDSISNFSSSQS